MLCKSAALVGALNFSDVGFMFLRFCFSATPLDGVGGGGRGERGQRFKSNRPTLP